MRRIAALLVLGLLTACVPPAGDLDAGADAERAAGVVCRVGPDGGPVVAERGIGGTGAPKGAQTATQIADRGIGGTGIVGVITGFASICVDGLEMRYDNASLVDIDGTAMPTSALRAGQVAVIQAQGPRTAPYARTISVRREIAGRIEAIELGSGTLTVAGQAVSVPSGILGARKFRLGDWVAVSGLRRSDGMIVASRLDRAPANAFIARGQVVRDGAVARVGNLVLHGASAASLSNGQFVTVSGHYVSGRPQASTVRLDTLFPNPGEFFGPSVNHLVIQSFVRVANGVVWLNGLKVNAARRVHGHFEGVAIVALDRRPDGTYTAVGLHYVEPGGPVAGTVRGTGGWGQGNPPPPPPLKPLTGSAPAQPDENGASPPVSGTDDPTPSAGTNADTDPGALLASSAGINANPGSATLPAPAEEGLAQALMTANNDAGSLAFPSPQLASAEGSRAVTSTIASNDPTAAPLAAKAIVPAVPLQLKLPTAGSVVTSAGLPPEAPIAATPATNELISGNAPSGSPAAVASIKPVPRVGAAIRFARRRHSARAGTAGSAPIISLVAGTVTTGKPAPIGTAPAKPASATAAARTIRTVPDKMSPASSGGPSGH